jgi:16S rRNA (cytosine1402-N4)-methyltransferase
MDPSQSTTAGDIVNRYSEAELASVIREFGQERRWRSIARAIVRARQKEPLETTGQLARVITSAVPGAQVVKTLARTFQSLRVVINEELEELHRGLGSAVELLKPGGRLVVICYQSLEDRIVKDVFARFSGACQCPREMPRCVCGARKILQVLTRKARRPSAEEIEQNPRARSARLRAAEKQAPEVVDGRGKEKKVSA